MRGIFDGDAPLQGILRAGNVAGDARQRRTGTRERQQVGVVGAAPGRPGEVFGYQRRLNAPRQRGQSLQMRRVRFGIRGERKRDTMQ